MASYTLITFCGAKQAERFDHRSAGKLRSILEHPKFHCAGKTDPWGQPQKHPDRFEILDTHMYTLFNGNIGDAVAFVRTLR